MNRIRYSRRIHDSEYTPYIKRTYAGVRPKIAAIAEEAMDIVAKNFDNEEYWQSEMNDYTSLTLKDVKGIVKYYVKKNMFTKEELETIYEHYSWRDAIFSLNEAFKKFLDDVAEATLDYLNEE